MRADLIIDDILLERAIELTGIRDVTTLVRAALEALLAREAGKRLAGVGGSQPEIQDVPRRQSS